MVTEGNLETCAGCISLSFNSFSVCPGLELSRASQLRCVSGTFPPEGEGTTQRCDLGHGGMVGGGS